MQENKKRGVAVLRGLQHLSVSAVVIVVFLLAWEFLVRALQISPLVLPSPSTIFRAAFHLVQQPWFGRHLTITVSEVLIGFSISITFGVLFGALISKFRLAEIVLSPFLIGSQVTPKVALMPLFILWFGFGIQSKVFMVALLSFFPILKNTILGFRSIPERQYDLFRIIGANRIKVIRSLEVPAILPFVLTGIETASVLAVTGAIVGEYLGGNEGLGALIVMTLNALKVDQMFATVLILMVFGIVFYTSVSSLRRLLIRAPSTTALEN
ncbi:ABC transporter permease [Allopusillimonas ginsengisoli]|uniref:ABC transporter permease n=1 Tax=Allopusillimonas ginsengisoli TaxID=453575 RepID=UPI00101FB40A|nr:ABC transporter permease [Allopusillimonas ginsengisoli]TEA76862.1 ABC transporter permease [Allopusillimonas ginsengisoli]